MAAIGQSRPTATGIRTPLFILGVALALLAFLLMLVFGAIFASRSHSTSSVRVVIASQDIAQREVITADMITYGSVSSDSLPPKAFTHVADLTGFAAIVEILKGQVLTWTPLTARLKYVLLSYHDYQQTQPPADSACPPTTAPGIIGPAQVEARWGFTR